jgi:hypothetical protein
VIDVLRQIPRLIQLRRIWFSLYLVKAVLAFLFVIPFYLTTNSILASSSFSKSLLQEWDLSVIIELFSGRGEMIPVYIISFLIGAIVYLLIVQFINGGLYYIMVSGKSIDENGREFFAECGANFGRHLKITLLMLPIYLVLFVAGMSVINILDLVGKNIAGAGVMVWLIFKGGILMLIMLAASIFSDSTRAASAAFPEKGLRELFKAGAVFFRPEWLKLLWLYIITYFPFVLIWLLTESIALLITGHLPGAFSIFIELLLFQLSSLTRTGQKLWFLILLGKQYKTLCPGRFLPEQAELSLNG